MIPTEEELRQALVHFTYQLSPSATMLLLWLVQNIDRRDILLGSQAASEAELIALARELRGQGCCEAAALLIFRAFRSPL